MGPLICKYWSIKLLCSFKNNIDDSAGPSRPLDSGIHIGSLLKKFQSVVEWVSAHWKPPAGNFLRTLYFKHHHYLAWTVTAGDCFNRFGSFTVISLYLLRTILLITCKTTYILKTAIASFTNITLEVNTTAIYNQTT